MATQNKAPIKKGGWGSMLSSAVAGLESRLDTILADGPDAQKVDEAQKIAEATKATALLSASSTTTNSGTSSRDASRARANDRLAERLARATAQRSRLQMDSAANSEGTTSARTSIEIKRHSSDIAVEQAVEETDVKDTTQEIEPEPVPVLIKLEVEEEDSTTEPTIQANGLLASSLPINPARISVDSPRASLDLAPSDGFDSSRPSTDLANGHSRSTIELEAEMERMRQDYETTEKQRQEEMHAHLERIDALQAKLQYLAKETVAAAKQANASMASGSPESKLAQKDEQIALLMEEGQQLSKTELRHLQTIKKLRVQGQDSEKTMLEMRKKLDKAERCEMEQKHKVRRAEASERQAQEKAKQVSVLEKQLDNMRGDRDRATEQVASLTLQLQEAEKRAAKAIEAAQNKALEADKNRIADLENELEDAQIEKKLAEDRAQAEVKKIKEDADRQRERWAVTELELSNEIKSYEARLEAMRARAEEASTEAEGAESGAKLLRQIELLQNQYNLAKTNWETIEGSLSARLVAMEKDRDEASRREAEVRKKARDAGSKARKAAEENEIHAQQLRDKDAAIAQSQSRIDTLQRSVQDADAALADAKVDFERQRSIWESELAAKVEEEKARWQRKPRKESLPLSRKASGIDVVPKRGASRIGEQFPGFERTRRSSGAPRSTATPERELLSPPFSTHGSMLSFDTNGMPPAPSEIDEDEFDRGSSPQQTINDIVSTTVTGAGPTVQLVERMSAAVRKLEAEKATHKDELSRLGAQRDEARNQIVSLMREVEEARGKKSRVVELEKEMQGVQQRYDACLEMLGEREEEVEELKADVIELKQIYRELVEEKVGR